ncbi:hypothetical protein [Campylobacter lanienae]|uniref:hypothetical protein n=1 Tax=Campylobacter lanienae TaxID=75658 RepID=UPI000BB449BE|nr:hypothetical protein [Campylobacter lanienae]
MRKIFISSIIATTLATSSFSINLDSIIDNAQGSLGGLLGNSISQYWKEIDKYTSGVAGMCYTPSVSLGSGDICDIVNSIANLNFNVCGLAPNIAGMQKKSQYIGLYGLKRLCSNQIREFKDIASSTIQDFSEDVFGEQPKAVKLPNGKSVEEHFKMWNINDIVMKDNTDNSLVKKYILNNDNAMVRLMMDYSTSKEATNKNPSDITINDIAKAPSDLKSYNQGIYDLSKTISDNTNDTSAYSIGSAIKLKVNDANGDPTQAQKHLNDIQRQYDIAKNIEISNALKLAREDSDIPIPTQDYIDILREDLKPKAVAQIRKQQLRDAQIVKEINEKWDRKVAINKLIADKEVIMSLQFNENEAKAKIESIVNSVGTTGSIGGIPSI